MQQIIAALIAFAFCAGCQCSSGARPDDLAVAGTPILKMTGTETEVISELRSHLDAVATAQPDLEITAQIMMVAGLHESAFQTLADECNITPAVDYGVAFGGEGDETSYLPIEHETWDDVWLELIKYPSFAPGVEPRIVAVDVFSSASNLSQCWAGHEDAIRAIGVYGATSDHPSAHGWLLMAPHTPLGNW